MEFRYSSDKPKDCRYCYFWKNNKAGCELGEGSCYYRIEEKSQSANAMTVLMGEPVRVLAGVPEKF